MSSGSEQGADGHRRDHETVDLEHRIQIGLLDALTEAIRGDRPIEEIREIHERLLDYSRVHFLSEQLLMRLHAYPGHDRHVADHDEMIRTLEDLGDARDAGRLRDDERRIMLLRAFLLGHIDGRDRELAEHLANSNAGRAER